MLMPLTASVYSEQIQAETTASIAHSHTDWLYFSAKTLVLN